MAPSPVQKSISPLAWALLGLLALIWGGSFLSNRATVGEIPVLTIVAFRVGGAALLLWAYVLWRRLPIPDLRWLVWRFLGMGLLNNVLPFSLIVWGQGHIPSGLAAVLNASTAIFTVLLAALIFPDERLTARKLVGVATGFVGVVVTIGLDQLRELDLASLGQLAVVAASICYAVSGAYARIVLRGIRPEVSAAGMLGASACIMLPLALVHDSWPALDYSPAAWAGLCYLAFVASALAYMIFYRVLALAGAGNLSLVTLLVAPVAVALGALVYGERLSTTEYLGFALLATGLLIIDGRPRAIFGR